MYKIVTCLLSLSNDEFEEENIKQLIVIYQDNLDCRKLAATLSVITASSKRLFSTTKILKYICGT